MTKKCTMGEGFAYFRWVSLMELSPLGGLLLEMAILDWALMQLPRYPVAWK